MMSLKSRLFKHKRALIALMAISLFTISIGIAAFLSSQTPNTNYFPTPLLNNPQNNNNININAKDYWLPGWNYRKNHTIVGSTAGALTNYQMRIVVHYGSGADSGENVYCNSNCRTDFGDIRFTKSDGTTLLNYWLESKTDGDKATFWVEVDSIPANPNTVGICVYYGNPGASTTSNGQNTFVLFDDFNTLNTTIWNSTDLVYDAYSGWVLENGNLVLYVGTRGTSKVWAVDQYVRTNGYYDLNNRVFEVRTNMSMGGTVADPNKPCTESGIGFQFFTPGDAQERFYCRQECKNDWLRYTGIIAPYAVLWDDPSWDGSATGYYVLGLRLSGNDTWLYENMVLQTTYNDNLASDNVKLCLITLPAYYHNDGWGEQSIDWVRIRNLANPEPTHGAWGSQELNVEIWNDTIINDTQTIYGKAIILNGNLTIASGGSLTLTSVTLMVNCSTNGEHGIEVQSGGTLYINDTDGNPDTKNDATNITAYNPNYNFLFRVLSGATFQMNNSELHYCGYYLFNDYPFAHSGLWINTNNAIVENNTFTNNYIGVMLFDAYNNTLSGNNATNNDCGFYLGSDAINNTLSGNNANNNYQNGFYLYSCDYNTLSGNNANNSIYGFTLNSCYKNTFSGNTASNNNWGFYLCDCSSNNLSGNTAINNIHDFYWDDFSYSNGNVLKGIIVANYLLVEVLGQTGGPVQGAEVRIDVDGHTIYASPKFGGSNSTTDQNGLTNWIIVPYQTRGMFNWVDNTTTLTVSYFELNITNSPRVVDMSYSHKETFVVENVNTSITTSIGAGPNQYVNASVQMGTELTLNLTAPVKMSIIKFTDNLKGSAPSGFSFLGKFISIEVDNTTAIQGITITIHYTDQEVTGSYLNENSLAIWYWNETSGNWTQLPSTVDPQNNTVTANTDHLTFFAILGTPIPPGNPILLYLPLLLFLLLTPSGLNPLVYLVLGLVAVAVVTVAGLGLRRRREEQVPEAEAPTIYARPTPQSATRYARIQTPLRSGEEASGQRIVLEVRRAMPKYGTRPSTVSKRGKPSKTRVPVGDLEARRTALKDLMDEVNARFDAGKLTHEEYVEIYSKYRAKLASVEKKLGRFEACTPVLGKSCCLFCGSEITGEEKYCPNCGGARLKCSVCQQHIASGEPLVRCPHCRVLSHREHLLEWIKVKGYCPRCRKKLRETDIV